MKKYIFLLLVLVTGFSACKKDQNADDFDTAAQATKDDVAINAYLTANHINAVKDPSGIYYTIVTPGTGSYPTSSSTVIVDYTGKILNGGQFDQGTDYTAVLNGGVIAGWTIGVPRINTGGTIVLYVPSAMGYANVQNGSIPPNSVLVFTITLKSIQ